jgi:hypothetical protein
LAGINHLPAGEKPKKIFVDTYDYLRYEISEQLNVRVFAEIKVQTLGEITPQIINNQKAIIAQCYFLSTNYNQDAFVRLIEIVAVDIVKRTIKFKLPSDFPLTEEVNVRLDMLKADKIAKIQAVMRRVAMKKVREAKLVELDNEQYLRRFIAAGFRLDFSANEGGYEIGYGQNDLDAKLLLEFVDLLKYWSFADLKILYTKIIGQIAPSQPLKISEEQKLKTEQVKRLLLARGVNLDNLEVKSDFLSYCLLECDTDLSLLSDDDIQNLLIIYKIKLPQGRQGKPLLLLMQRLGIRADLKLMQNFLDWLKRNGLDFSNLKTTKAVVENLLLWASEEEACRQGKIAAKSDPLSIKIKPEEIIKHFSSVSPSRAQGFDSNGYLTEAVNGVERHLFMFQLKIDLPTSRRLTFGAISMRQIFDLIVYPYFVAQIKSKGFDNNSIQNRGANFYEQFLKLNKLTDDSPVDQALLQKQLLMVFFSN